jgi:hypothetical protein
VLEELFAIKKRLTENKEEAEDMKLDGYKTHFSDLYQMSYNDFKKLVVDADKAQMRNLVNLAIRVDIIKHIHFIGIQGQAGIRNDDPIRPDSVNITPKHYPFIKVVAEVTNALMTHGGSNIIDPDRSIFDWLYEDRFMEFAAKKHSAATRGTKGKAVNMINIPYAGMRSTMVVEAEDEDEGDDDDFNIYKEEEVDDKKDEDEGEAADELLDDENNEDDEDDNIYGNL